MGTGPISHIKVLKMVFWLARQDQLTKRLGGGW